MEENKKKTTAANKNTSSKKKTTASKKQTGVKKGTNGKKNTAKKPTTKKGLETKNTTVKKAETKEVVAEEVISVEEVNDIPKEKQRVEAIKEEASIAEEPAKPENRKFMTLLFILVGIVLFVLVGVTAQQNKEKALKSITVDEYVEKLKGSEKSLIYVGRPTCSYCQKFKPELLNVLNEKDLTAYYFDIDTIQSQEDYDKYVNSSEKIQENSGTTPLFLVVQNGEVIDLLNGYHTQEDIEKFLDKSYYNKEKEEDKSQEESSDKGVVETSVSDYLDVLQSEDKNIVFIGRPTCSYCVKLKPHLEEIADENNLKIYYVNIDEMSEEDTDKFFSSTDAFDKENLSTPMVLITKDGKVIDSNTGYMEKSKYEDFFKKNELIK